MNTGGCGGEASGSAGPPKQDPKVVALCWRNRGQRGNLLGASERRRDGRQSEARRDRRDQPRGILVIVGIVVAIVWSFWLGLIIALIGLIAFGGFARGKWY
jgi:hypothetical protein